VDIKLCLNDYKWKNYNQKKVERLLEEFGFKSLIKRIPNTGENLKLW
jgi:hypothetical protein